MYTSTQTCICTKMFKAVIFRWWQLSGILILFYTFLYITHTMRPWCQLVSENLISLKWPRCFQMLPWLYSGIKSSVSSPAPLSVASATAHSVTAPRSWVQVASSTWTCFSHLPLPQGGGPHAASPGLPHATWGTGPCSVPHGAPTIPALKSQLQHLPAVGPSASCLPSLGFCFLTCKTGKILVPNS